MNVSLRQEYWRKTIHLSSLWIPAAYHFLDREPLLWLVGAAWLVTTLFEILRIRYPGFSRLSHRIFGAVFREREQAGKPTGAFWFLLGAWLAVYLFPKEIAQLSLLVLIISDTLASLAGRHYSAWKQKQGKVITGKTWAGSMAFLLSALVLAAAMYGLMPEVITQQGILFYGATSLLASCIATWAERECGYWHLDDNLMIPIAFGAVMQAGYLIAMIY